MTCNQLGGACDMEFKANSFEEIVEMSKKQGITMFQSGDKAHLRAMSEKKQLMKSPEAMAAWFENKGKNSRPFHIKHSTPLTVLVKSPI